MYTTILIAIALVYTYVVYRVGYRKGVMGAVEYFLDDLKEQGYRVMLGVKGPKVIPKYSKEWYEQRYEKENDYES